GRDAWEFPGADVSWPPTKLLSCPLSSRQGHCKKGSVPVTCETPRKNRKNKRAFAPITRYRDTTKFCAWDAFLCSLPALTCVVNPLHAYTQPLKNTLYSSPFCCILLR